MAGTARAERQEVGVPMETQQREELPERWAVNPAVVFRELDGEGVLLNLDSGVYFGLDAVGMRVWTLLLEHGATGPVCAQMEREYEVGLEVLEEDVRRLVSELRDKGLIVAAAP